MSDYLAGIHEIPRRGTGGVLGCLLSPLFNFISKMITKIAHFSSENGGVDICSDMNL